MSWDETRRTMFPKGEFDGWYENIMAYRDVIQGTPIGKGICLRVAPFESAYGGVTGPAIGHAAMPAPTFCFCESCLKERFGV